MEKNKTYTNGERLWHVIDSMVEMLNEESVRKEYINPNTSLSVGYTMADIAFDHTIELKDGFISIKEGLQDENQVVIDISSQDFHDLNMGKLNPTLALVQKRIKFLKGDIKQVILAGNMPTMVYYKEAYNKMEEA
ncbi:SCP2 sterol-binding domain-containing protein [Fusibacter sp. JL216-2]|uniref:SCP2 sterol-binding domain-containing protein n=1 Tax=Fusibacter sp. JL216-2 TaxID=3071453 RepID=UPI003D352BE4